MNLEELQQLTEDLSEALKEEKTAEDNGAK